MKNRILAPAMLLAGLAAAPVAAQTTTTSAPLPNYGNYQALRGTFRVGVSVFNPVTGQSAQQAFEQDEIDDITQFLDPTVLSARFGTVYNQLAAVTGIVDLRGSPAVAGFAQNSTTLSVRVVAPDGNLVYSKGTPCSVSYTGTTRQASFAQFDDATEDVATPTSRFLLRCIAQGFASYTPVDPVAGNPFSLQSSLVRSSLDLTNGDSLVEESGGANTAGDPWIIGATYASGSAGRFDVSRIDARINRSFRIAEGSRGLLKIDLPFSYSRVNGTQSYAGQVGLGYEIPVIARRWSLEPRVAYGITGSDALGSIGHIVQGTVASRYVVDGLGRGRLVIGNMAGYTTTLATPFVGYNIDPGIQNWVFRNGLAYEMPLKLRAGGRSLSVRGSYNFTVYTGDDLYNNNFHEATLSIGIRGREESIRAARDLIRINFSTVQARGFHTYSAGLGFRF